MPQSWTRASRILFGSMMALGLLMSCHVVASEYTYDTQGRLKTVKDANNNVAEYVYDIAGNLLEIRRHDVTQLAITSFAKSGPAGTLVTVNGSGFAAIPAGDQVSFNGAAATVGTASPTSLSTTVPVGASSGTIAITANGQTAQSADAFNVTADDGAPTISGFSPTCTLADQTVSVTGTNFDPRPNATRVEVGEEIASATVLSSTALTIKAPRATAGGKIRVVTAAGTAESAEPLTVLAAGLSCANGWGESHWLEVDGPDSALALPQPKYGVFYFSGRRGQLVSLQVSDVVPAANFFTATLILSRARSADRDQAGCNFKSDVRL